jgi:WD40 repeat protein
MKRLFPVLTLVCLLMGASARFNVVQAANPPASAMKRSVSVVSSAASSVSAVAVSPDGRLAAVAGFNRSIRLLDIAAGRELETFRMDPILQPVTALAFVPDSSARPWIGSFFTYEVDSARYGGHIRLLATSKAQSFGFSRDGKKAAFGTVNGELTVLDTTTGKPLQVFKVAQAYVNAVVFLGDEELLTASGAELRRWRLGSDAAVETIPLGRADSSLDVDSVLAFDAAGRQAACAERGGGISIWEIASGRRVRVLKGDGASGAVVAFMPDGSSFISGGTDPKLRVWDVAGLTPPRALVAEVKPKSAEPESLATVGEVGISECDEYLRLYEKCLDDPRIPEAARATMKSSIEQTRKAWKDLLEKARNSPGADAAFKATAEACREAAKALKANQFCQ